MIWDTMDSLLQMHTLSSASGSLTCSQISPGLFALVTSAKFGKLRMFLSTPTGAMPALLFSCIYMDTMYIPKSGRFKYIVQGQCLLCHCPEFDMLAAKNHKPLGEFILHSFIY